MPKQFQRTQGLKTGIGVGTAQVFGKSDIPAHIQQNKKLGLAEHQQKAKALKDKAALLQKYAVPETGFFTKGLNGRADRIIKEYKGNLSKVDWSDPQSQLDIASTFNELKTQLNIMTEIDEGIKGNFNNFDLDKRYHNRDKFEAMLNEDDLDPFDAQAISGMLKQTHDIESDINTSVANLGTTIHSNEEGAKTTSGKYNREKDIRNAIDLEFDFMSKNYGLDLKEKGLDTKAAFEEHYRGKLDKESKVSFDETRTSGGANKQEAIDKRAINIKKIQNGDRSAISELKGGKFGSRTINDVDWITDEETGEAVLRLSLVDSKGEAKIEDVPVVDRLSINNLINTVTDSESISNEDLDKSQDPKDVPEIDFEQLNLKISAVQKTAEKKNQNAVESEKALKELFPNAKGISITFDESRAGFGHGNKAKATFVLDDVTHTIEDLGDKTAFNNLRNIVSKNEKVRELFLKKKKEIKSSDIASKAKAGGYTESEYRALLEEKGIKIRE